MRRIIKRGLRARLSDFISNRIKERRSNYIKIDDDFEDIDFDDIEFTDAPVSDPIETPASHSTENQTSQSAETKEPIKNKTTLKDIMDKGYSIEQIRAIEDKLLLFNENYDDPRFQEELSKITPAKVQDVKPSEEPIEEHVEEHIVESEGKKPKTPEEVQEAYYQACEEMINEVKKIQDDIANKERIIREDEANSKKFEEMYNRPDDIYKGRIEFTKKQIEELKVILANYLREEIDYYVDGKPYKKVTRKQAIDFYNNHLDTINRQKEYQEKEARKKEEAKIPDLEKELRDIEYNLTIGTYYRESPEKAKEMAARRDELYSQIKGIKESAKKEDTSNDNSVKPDIEKKEEPKKDDNKTQSELSLEDIISRTEQINLQMQAIIGRIKSLSEELGKLSETVDKMRDPLDELRGIRTRMDSLVTSKGVLPKPDENNKPENSPKNKLEELKEMRRYVESLSNRNKTATISPLTEEDEDFGEQAVARHI